MTIITGKWGRRAAPVIAGLLAAGLVGAYPAPASAATTKFSQPNKLFVGGPNYQPVNDNSITIPDNTVATPYPSEINVTHQGAITDLDVRLSGVNHAFPDDIDVMLVGPQGQQVTLMSDAGGSDDVAGVNLTFDDGAASPLPDSTQISSGTFKPTEFENASDVFPAPAPVNNHNTSLGVFNGTNPVGTWRLYVRDDQGTDTGFITSWRLIIDQETTPYPSTISVAGLPAVTDVNVTLNGLASTYPDDLDLLLVGPQGQQATILSDAGGSGDVTGVNLTLDDEAAASVPDEPAPLASGTYKPTDYEVGDGYPAPAPVATGSTALSVFDGTIPNGTWSLYAADDGSDDLVEIDSWSLQISWADTQSPSGAVLINGGAATTSSQSVTLSLNATDPVPSSGLAQMRFSNDGVTFSAYQAYAVTAPWTLSAGDGTKTVFAQFRDADGNQSAVTSDSITLDALGPHSTKTTPKNKAKDVKRTTKVKIKANEPLAGGSVSKKTVILKVKGGDTVKAKVSYNSAKMMIVITPKNDLKKHTTYKVKVKTSVKDLVGHGWDENGAASGTPALKFSFTTA
jgi:subtilisin-like proprotein convertase family protein